jgi:hypothetical protein
MQKSAHQSDLITLIANPSKEKTEDEQRGSVVCGVWCVVCGVWCVVCGVVCVL